MKVNSGGLTVNLTTFHVKFCMLKVFETKDFEISSQRSLHANNKSFDQPSFYPRREPDENLEKQNKCVQHDILVL